MNAREVIDLFRQSEFVNFTKFLESYYEKLETKKETNEEKEND